MALIVFAITLFVSAFMLFLVQPMIGKMILPKLGGTPQVWNTCMLFFQTVLLAGYFYTHATTTYLKPRKQMILHGILLFLPLFVMLAMGRPFDVTSWVPPTGSNPIFAALLLLLTIVGLPFFVVSTSAPLLQKWFSFSGDPTAKDPYFLYGASNFGSLLSLAAYPFFVEPWFDVSTQTWIWFGGYVCLMGMFFGAASLVWKQADEVAPAAADMPAPSSVVPDPLPAQTVPTTAPTTTAVQSGRMVGKKKGLKGSPVVPSAAAHVPSVARKPAYDPQEAPVTLRRCIRWALLAAVPSSLMLGVTSYVSTDLSPFPLVWAIPLALYLLTFILVFARWPVVWTKEPHTLALFLAFLAVAVFCFVLFTRNYSPTAVSTFLAFFAIFIITLALHGELAKDRPAPRNLTLFFLLMSFGGMLGGLFNALIAPVVFTNIVEYPLAVIIGCFLLPNLAERGFTDGKLLEWMPDLDKSITETSDTFAQSFGQKPEGKPFLFNYFWDIVIGIFIALVAWATTSNAAVMGNWFIGLLGFLGGNEQNLFESFQGRGPVFLLAVYGIPIVLCLCVLARSVRFAVGIAGLLFFGYFVSDRDRNLLYAGRSYFGVLKVNKDVDYVLDKTGRPLFTEAEDIPKIEFEVPFNFLMHGSTYHGRNYQIDELSRLATTYYHRFGPVGCVMEKYNWLPGKQNTYYADLRMPATIIGLGAAGTGICSLPLEQLTNAWSEPAIATVGLGTGTMASYGRPFGHVVYYEIDDKIRAMSLPPDGKAPFFRYVKEAGDRGAFVEIIMGDARLSLEREKEREAERLEKNEGGPTAMRNGYYKVIVLDAFSSDAIPVHLITKKAVEVYMEKLAPDGVLCVHTSNRHLQLVDPVADIAQDLKLDWLRGHDNGGADRDRRAPRKDTNRVNSLGHFGSEYIMLARKGVLDKAKLKTAIRGYPANQTTSICVWEKNQAPNRPVWTDNYQNIMSILR